MGSAPRKSSWVVYGAVIRGKPTGLTAVCNEVEWQAMERGEPGCRLLIKSGIATEGEAEWIARATVLASIPSPIPIPVAA